jgi:hypothetical protein
MSVSYDETCTDAIKLEINVNYVASDYNSNCVVTFNDIHSFVYSRQQGPYNDLTQINMKHDHEHEAKRKNTLHRHYYRKL